METDPRRRDPEDVKRLFARVSARYDAINRAMCGGLDVLWRGRLAKTAAALARENGGGGGKKYLDIACGSGDVCARLLGEDPDCRVVGADFCPEMLALAREKCGIRRGRLPQPPVRRKLLRRRDDFFRVQKFRRPSRVPARDRAGSQNWRPPVRFGGRAHGGPAV